MKIKSQQDFWSGVVFLAIGLCFAVGATHYEIGSAASPKPGYLPLILSGVLMIVGALVLFTSLTIETEDGERVSGFAWRPLAVVSLAMALFAWTLPILGLIMAAPLSALLASFASDDRGWKTLVLNPVIASISTWLIFSVALNWNVPLWPAPMSVPQ